MALTPNKILIIGGYGAVGRVLSTRLSEKYPDLVLIGGRNKKKAENLIIEKNLKAHPIYIDLEIVASYEHLLDAIHTVICCVEYLEDDFFIEQCSQAGINYIELATSYEAYQRLLKFGERFMDSNAVLVPGVGLMPGLSGVFSTLAISTFHQIKSVSSFVLLGLGEKHGLDAIRWMVQSANKSFFLETESGPEKVETFGDPIKIRLLHEQAPRTFYRFDFGDQHIIKNEMAVQVAETRLAFDIRWVNALVRIAKRLGLLAWISRMNPKTIQRILNSFSIGSDQFAVQTRCLGEQGQQITYLAYGRNEASATAIIAAYVVAQVYERNDKKGLLRMEEVIVFESFQQYLYKNEIEVCIR